jgi:hypothetical protein
MNGTNKRKKYFPNNWKKYKDAPAAWFEPHYYLDIMDWKLSGWELPPDVCCIIRATHLETKRVKEYVYKQEKSADNKIKKLIKPQTHDLCITTHEAQHYIGPDPFPGSIDDEPINF